MKTLILLIILQTYTFASIQVSRHWVFSGANYAYFKAEKHQGYTEVLIKCFRLNLAYPVVFFETNQGNFESSIVKVNKNGFTIVRIYNRELDKVKSINSGLNKIIVKVLIRGKPPQNIEFFPSDSSKNELIKILKYSEPCHD